ncbi:hypothetical protein BS17DRAFT_814658 [Gyrodon lividus]|nr:hypothetical protein BS17DRAFT_814658 [Gyrodon lividus]
MTELLTPGELFWRDRYPFLQRKGYTLRIRYSPNWVPSWQGKSNALPHNHEDRVAQPHPDVCDATARDGAFVFIKRIRTNPHPFEAQIALLFSKPELCERNIHYIVMPLLRHYNHPEFETVPELLDFRNQVLQGLKFMHENRVSHGDCLAANIMMDAKYLCPYDWHPVATGETRNFTGKFYYKSRSDVEVVYYVDFGLSTLHPQGQTRFVTGGTGRDREVPEFKFEIPYDPFKADIFILGHMFQTEFLVVSHSLECFPPSQPFPQKYRRLENLEPLIRLMTAQSPNERPTAEDALKSFERIRNIFSASSRAQQQRLRRINESDAESVAKDVAFTARHSINRIWS